MQIHLTIFLLAGDTDKMFSYSLYSIPLTLGLWVVQDKLSNRHLWIWVLLILEVYIQDADEISAKLTRLISTYPFWYAAQ